VRSHKEGRAPAWPRLLAGTRADLNRRVRTAFSSGVAPIFLVATIGLIVSGTVMLAVGFEHQAATVTLASLLCNGLALVPLALFYRSSALATASPSPTITVDRVDWLARLRDNSVLVVLAATTCAVAATVWSARTHSMLLYGDARSHLNIARRVTDSLRPGLVQLGSVWLPLPHILLVPLVAFYTLWQSGAAGAIVGGGCFIYSAQKIYALVVELTGSRAGAWCALAVYVGNLNLLYLQSTALTEPVLLAFLIGAIYHLARWMRDGSARSLAIAGGMTFCATLSRYEGWALLVAATLLVLWWTRRGPARRHEAEANGVVYGVIGGYGVVLWVLYNLIIFHNPLYFIQSTFSAQSQQVALSKVGMLVTNGHLGASILTYGWTVFDVVGPLSTVAGCLCGILLWAVRGRDGDRTAAVLSLLFVPVAFNVVSLWLGQSTLRVPQVAPFGMWNDRYGIMALPFVAVAIGATVARWPKLLPAALAVALATPLLMAQGTPLTIQDGRTGISSAAGGRPELAAEYLRHHYHGGLVLADDSSASPFMFATGLDLRNFVIIGFEPWYEDALRSPETTVKWVVTFVGDAIAADMSAHPGRFQQFRLMITDGRIRVFEDQAGR
jgi:hypothetical protein